MAHADVLHQLVLAAAELVEIAVYLREVHVVVEVVLQVFHRGGLARGAGQTRLHELAEHLVVNPVEAHAVERAVQYQVAAVEQDVLDLRQHTAHLLPLPVAGLALLAEQVEPRMAPGLLFGNPHFR